MQLKLKDIGNITTGKTPSKKVKNAFNGDVNFVTPRDMSNNRYSDYTERTLSKIGVKALNNQLIESPSISVSCIGSDMGKTIFNRKKVITNQQINTISNFTDKVDPMYLYYLLVSKRSYLHFLGSGQGSTMPILNKKDFGNILLNFPSLKSQQKIAYDLDVIDQKIELNYKINDNLESLMFKIFKHEIVNDKTGKKQTLTDIANYKNGLAMQKYRPKNNEVGLPVLKIKELNQGFTDNASDFCSPSIDSDVIVNTGDIIFSWSGTLLVKLWSGKTSGLNQHLFKVTSNSYPDWFIYEWTKYYLQKFQEIAKDKATTMGHIKRSDLKNSTVIVPSGKKLDNLNKIFIPIYQKILENIYETNTLLSMKSKLLDKYF